MSVVVGKCTVMIILQALHNCLTCGRTTQCDEMAIRNHAWQAHGWDVETYKEKQRLAEAGTDEESKKSRRSTRTRDVEVVEEVARQPRRDIRKNSGLPSVGTIVKSSPESDCLEIPPAKSDDDDDEIMVVEVVHKASNIVDQQQVKSEPMPEVEMKMNLDPDMKLLQSTLTDEDFAMNTEDNFDFEMEDLLTEVGISVSDAETARGEKKPVKGLNQMPHNKRKELQMSSKVSNMCEYRCSANDCEFSTNDWGSLCRHFMMIHKEKIMKRRRSFISRRVLHRCRICSSLIDCDMSVIKSHLATKHPGLRLSSYKKTWKRKE